jgi:hypothetical protein
MKPWPCTLLLLLASAVATADDAPDPNQPERITLTLSAAGEPRPALKYSLAIGSRERQPGNAAPFYYRALLARRSLPEAVAKEYANNEKAWNEGTLDAAQQAELKKWLEGYRIAFHELRTAVYREHCDWDFRMQDLKGTEAVAFLLPEMQESRDLARALRVKARLEIAERRYDDAVETLRWGFQLARDCSEQPLLISNLVGIAISAIMTQPLVELMDAPGSPNLFWAMATLPQPLVDVRRALEFERGFPEQIFPFLKDAEEVERSPQEWQRILEQTLTDLSALSTELNLAQGTQPWQRKAELVLMIAKAYPEAKAQLMEQGMDAERVEQMSVAQVVAIQTARKTRESYDEVFKTVLLPYPESMALAGRVEASLQGRMASRVYLGSHGLPIAELLMPATRAVKRAEIRGPRQFAALQAIEAVRMHAASTGKLPATLAEITVVPVPPNPITRQPFPYRLQGNEAVLELPILADETPRSIGKKYVLSLEK